MRPALPNEVSSAGPRRSTSTVARPRFCRCSAVLMPTMPAPRTSASAFFKMLEEELLHAAEPAVVVAGLDAHVIEHLGVRQHQEALGRHGLHDLVHHLLDRERAVHARRAAVALVHA